MTKQIVYRGSEDFRILDSEDLQKGGVEAGVFRKTEFPRYQPVDVEDAVANALIERSDLYGKFALHEVIDETSVELDGVDEGATASTTDSTPVTGAKTAGSSKRA